MTTYIMLATWTDQGIRQVRGSPERFDAARAAIRDMGGDIRDFYMTTGDPDLVIVYEAPDDAVSARFALLLGELGYVRTRMLKAFPEQAYREIIRSLG